MESSVAIVTRWTILQKNVIPNMVIRLGWNKNTKVT